MQSKTKYKVDMIHVGLHKTGTSWLQVEVFPRMSSRIISNELFSGRPVRLTIDDLIDADERKHYAEQIKERFGDVKILLVVRDKADLINSLYGEYVKKGGTMLWQYWKQTSLNWDYVNYERYIDVLNELFSDVKVMHYENMKKNKRQFIQEICDWIDCPMPNYRDYIVNRSLTNWERRKYILTAKIKHYKWLLRRLLEDDNGSGNGR